MTEPDEIEILQHSQKTKENTSFNNLNGICIKSEMVPQECNDEEEHNNLEITNIKFESFDKLQNESMPSIDELINQIKTEVDNNYNADFVECNEDHERDDDDDDDDKPLINLREDTERKRKLSALELNDYVNSASLKRFKTEISDSLIMETVEPKQKNLFDPIVYTKRLDDMLIFQNNLKGIKRSDIWNKVLHESKPMYENLEQTTNLPRPKCKHKDIQKLYDDIKRINNRRCHKKPPKMQSEDMENKEITSKNTEEFLCRRTINEEESLSNNVIIDYELNSCTTFDTIDLFDSDDEVTETKKTIASLNNVELSDIIELSDSSCDENSDELFKTSQSLENIESFELMETLSERRTFDELPKTSKSVENIESFELTETLPKWRTSNEDIESFELTETLPKWRTSLENIESFELTETLPKWRTSPENIESFELTETLPKWRTSNEDIESFELTETLPKWRTSPENIESFELTETLPKWRTSPENIESFELTETLPKWRTSPENIESFELTETLPKWRTSPENIESFELTETLPEKKASDIQDTAIVVPRRIIRDVKSAFVYTTRLNDMLILRDKLRYLDGKYVLNEIIRESKPNMNHLKPSKVSRGISLSRLQIKLAILNYKNKSSKKLGKKRYGDCNFIATDLFTRGLNQSDYTKILIDSETYNDINAKDDDTNSNQESDCFIYNASTKSIEEIDAYRNIALFIYNKNSKLLEMFVTDYHGNVIEFRNIKISTISSFSKYIDDFKHEVDSYIRIIKLTICCWFRRKINLIWTKTNKGITRFVKSTHQCLPRKCKCCCKPKSVPSSFKFSLGINKDLEFKYDQKEKGCNLIKRALVCRKPITVMSESEKLTNEEPLVVKIKREPFGIYKEAEDGYLVYPSGRIDLRITLSKYNKHLIDEFQQLKRNLQNTSKINEIECDINEEKTLISKLKEFNVSSNLIKYFQSGKVLKDNGETLTNINAPELKLTVEAPNIGHTRNTRKCTLATLIQIKDGLNDNAVINKEKKVNRNKKHRSLGNDSHMNLKRSASKINTALNNPQRLVVTCQNIPEIQVIINDVDASVAAVIINEFNNIFFALKTGKVVATIKSQVESTSSKEFLTLAKIVHQIHLTTQNLNLPPDLQIQLDIRSEPINVETKEEKCVTQNKIVRKQVIEKLKRKIDASENKTVEIKEDNCVTEKKVVNKTAFKKSKTKLDNHEDIRNTVNKHDMFTKFLSNDKKIHKNAFESYINQSENQSLPKIEKVFSLNDNKSIDVISDSKESIASYIVSDNLCHDIENEMIRTATPTGESYLPMNSRENHILPLFTNTIVENMIEAALNKYNTERKLSTKLIPVNVTVDKNTEKNLIGDLPNNATTTKEKNGLLRSLLEK